MKSSAKVVLYHGTDESRIPRIMKMGLKPSSRGHTKGRIYLTAKPQAAREYALQGGEARGYRVKAHAPAILRVAIPKMVLVNMVGKSFNPFFHPRPDVWNTDIGNAEEVFLENVIPAKFIKRVGR